MVLIYKASCSIMWLPDKDGGWILLVVLAPVTSKHSSRMFVLMEDFTIDGPDDTVVRADIK